jgi:cytochrome P450
MSLQNTDLSNLDFFMDHDPHPVWQALRAHDPLHWNLKSNGKGFWSVTRYADALGVYRDPMTFSSEGGIALDFDRAENVGPSETGVGQMMLMTDPPRHAKLRGVVNKRFTPRALAPYERHVRALAAEILGEVAPRGECDFVLDVAARLPTAVICEMMAIPRPDWPLMYTLANMSIGTADPEYRGGRSAEETGRAAQIEIFNYFTKLIADRRAAPGDDLVSAFVHGEVDSERLSDVEVLFNCFLVIIAGQETTRNAISGGFLALMQNRDQYARLRSDASLFPTALEEFLRWTTPVTHIMRSATADATIRGQSIRKGDKVVIWNASANRDEDVFPDPYRFDVGRTPNDHLAFGYGEHFCLGANLARLELRVMIEEVMKRMPEIELAGEPQRLRSNFVAGIKHMPVRFRPAV